MIDGNLTTMKDIAEKFGVSISTVSRALSGSKRVREDKRLAIQKYAAEHNFSPNDIAKSLRYSKRQPIKVIGVIVPEITHYYFSSVVSGIEERASERGYRIMITMSKESYEREVQMCQVFEAHQVCGIIVSQAKSTTRYDHFQSLIDKGITLVFYDRICTGVNASLVVVDDYMGAFNAVTYLIKTGCKRIAFYGMRGNALIGKNRFNGYKDALLKAGMHPDDNLIFECDNRDDAENITPRVLYTAKHMGLRIPEDVSVCGFTNGQRAIACDPQLTTVEQRGVEVGREAAEVLINKVEGLTPSEKIEKRVVRTRLVVRGSSR